LQSFAAIRRPSVRARRPRSIHWGASRSISCGRTSARTRADRRYRPSRLRPVRDPRRSRRASLPRLTRERLRAPGHAPSRCFRRGRNRDQCVRCFSNLERVPFALNRKCAGTRSRFLVWSHFLRKTGSPLFRKMLDDEAGDNHGGLALMTSCASRTRTCSGRSILVNCHFHAVTRSIRRNRCAGSASGGSRA
jgi:hypothetical protein